MYQILFEMSLLFRLLEHFSLCSITALLGDVAHREYEESLLSPAFQLSLAEVSPLIAAFACRSCHNR